MSIGNKLINARVETVHQKPAFKKAFYQSRCLIPADGYYEWLKVNGRKQPMRIISTQQNISALQVFGTGGSAQREQPYTPSAF